MSDPTVVCKHCDNLTKSTGTKMCHRCWELDHRIKNEPKLALTILLKNHRELILNRLSGTDSHS